VGASKSEKKVTLQTRDFGATVDVRFGGKSLSESKLREQVLGRAGQGRIVKQYGWTTPFGQAVAFEVEQATSQNLRIMTRSVFVPQDSGLLEFNLTAQPDKYSRYQKAFENLIASFRSE
jgi:hypothetical protein